MDLSRRTFIKSSIILPSLSASIFAGEEEIKSDKSVIWVWLGGGIAQTEFISPIPEAPVEYRSTTDCIKTKAGYNIGGSFENLAKVSDKITLVRSFQHENPSHSTATHWVMTGYNNPNNSPNSPQLNPSFGSIISSVFGPNLSNGMPTYVQCEDIQYDKSGWLSSQYNPFKPTEESIKSLSLNIKRGRFLERQNLLKRFDNLELNRDWSDKQKQAYSVLAGRVAEAFDINKEDKTTLNKYSTENSYWGRQTLLAKRLVKSGCKFVTLNFPGWDMHSNIKNGFETISSRFDKNIGLLIQDLHDEGLDKDVLIVISSEFGRTPRINKNSGRDHWPRLSSLVLSGGDYNHGRVIGKCDKNASEPITDPVIPQDITATIFDHFGIDKKIQKIDNQGRPRYFLEDGECIL